MTPHSKEPEQIVEALSQQPSVLGDPWVPIYGVSVDFKAPHFETAMSNLIRQPNINSTVIMRADILKENVYDSEKGDLTFVSKQIDRFPEFTASGTSEDPVLHRYLEDVQLRAIPLDKSTIKLEPRTEIIRRIIPRNPFKDHIINQTCLVLGGDDALLVVYVPHIKSADETPFYLPPVHAVGILYSKGNISIHYLPFGYNEPENGKGLRALDPAERPIRIALRLLQTSSKHSNGARTGYEKRVNHDVVVPKEVFQNRYISLKKKYLAALVGLWCESTDPKKHVFEDLAIASFLIEFWALRYPNKADIEFRDLGCGNGLLVHILTMEGYKGKGIDARARKLWATYPPEVQERLLEQIVIPSVLLKPHPALTKMAPHITDNGRLFQVPDASRAGGDESKPVPLVLYYSSSNLLQSSQVCTTEEFPPNTFIIGNHLDELTCWIPLLGFPFIVIPCCLHALSGARHRYSPRKNAPPSISAYGTLVDRVEDLAGQMGWVVEKEMLRIPSTRNAAIIGTERPSSLEELPEALQTRVLDIIAMEGGAEGWVEAAMALTKKAPRGH